MTTAAKPPCDEAQILSGAPPASSDPGGAWILAATILGSSMVFIDGTVVSVAAPVLQRALNATAPQVQWIVEAYLLFLASLLLTGGAMGDRFGRRRMFAIGVVLFALASAACGLSSGLVMLIIARAIQGIGGALLTPGSLALISASFGPEQRGRAIGTWSGSTSITAAIGPVLGGWLVQHASWRWIFFINVPIALMVLALVWLRVPESRDESKTGRVDWLGAALATAGLAAITLSLLTANDVGLANARVLSLLAGGVMALVAFVFVEARVPTPMAPLQLFRSRAFSGTNLMTLLLYAALSGALFFVPFELIQVKHYTPTAAGSALLPFVLLMFVLSRWSGGLVSRYGARVPLVIGPLIAAAGFGLFGRAAGGGSYWTTFFPAIAVLGLGMAISVAPLTTTVMGAVEQRYAGAASGINNAVSRTAGLLSIALLGLLMAAVFGSSLDRGLARLDLPADARGQLHSQRNKLAAAEIPVGLSDPARVSVEALIGASFTRGFRAVMDVASGLAISSAICAGFLIDGRARAQKDLETR